MAGVNGSDFMDKMGKVAMALTPPRASGRAAGNRMARLLVAECDGKTNDGLNAIG
jgi:hypothetical protein